MRRRDSHLVSVLIAMLAINCAVSFVCTFFALHYKRLFVRLSLETKMRLERAEKSSIEAASAALALIEYQSEMPSSGQFDTNGVLITPPVVIGYGRTRSKGAHYVYQDMRYYDGEVRRRYIYKVPFGTDVAIPLVGP